MKYKSSKKNKQMKKIFLKLKLFICCIVFSTPIFSQSTLYLFYSLPPNGPNIRSQILFNNQSVFEFSRYDKAICNFNSSGVLNISVISENSTEKMQLEIKEGLTYFVKIITESTQNSHFSIIELPKNEGIKAKNSYLYKKTLRFNEETSMHLFNENNLKNETASSLNNAVKFEISDQGFSWVKKPYWQDIGDLKQNLIAALENNKWGFIDNNLNWAIKPDYKEVLDFSEGFAAVKKLSDNVLLTEFQWGYIDKSGTLKIQLKFEGAQPFSEGLAAVRQSKNWGFIDYSGRSVIPFKFDMAESFSEGYAAVQDDSKWGYIDKTGKWAIPAIYDDAYSFNEGLALVKENGKWGYINQTGKWEIIPQFNDAVSFRDGFAGAQSNRVWGFIDKSGKWIIKPQFSSVNVFNDGVAGVQKNDRWGIVNKSGDWVIKPEFTDISFFKNGIAGVKLNEKWGIIGSAGNFVVNPEFDDFFTLADTDNQLFAVKQNNKWGVVSIKKLLSATIKNEVEKRINEWQKKGEFEKSGDYKIRVNETTRNAKAQEFAAIVIKEKKREYSQKIKWNLLQISDYDADNESFLIQSSELGNFIIPVPIAEAPSFKQNWGKIDFKDPDFYIQTDRFYLAKVTISNPVNGKKYLYDNKNRTDYDIKDIDYEPINYDDDLIPNEIAQNNSNPANKSQSVGPSDVDINIPIEKTTNIHSYSLIIGNEDYASYQTDLNSEVNVAFAVNDATTFKKYCTSALGIPEGNIRFLKNATTGQMRQSIAWINKIIEKEGGDAEVIVYYAGHGMPDEQTHESYIIPVDVSGTDLQSAIKLNDLYSKLSEFPSKKVTVFLDACFSGGGRGQGLIAARGVKVKPKKDQLNGNIVVFTSSSGEQSSLPYKEKQHGIFTYYLLKKLQASGGTVNYNELYSYIKKEVDLNCVKINNKEQTPDLLVPGNLTNKWMNWKLKE
jgi:hypothetical protein